MYYYYYFEYFQVVVVLILDFDLYYFRLLFCCNGADGVLFPLFLCVVFEPVPDPEICTEFPALFTKSWFDILPELLLSTFSLVIGISVLSSTGLEFPVIA